MRAGLIPSRALQERRIVHERNEQMKANPEDSELGEFNNTYAMYALIYKTRFYKLPAASKVSTHIL